MCLRVQFRVQYHVRFSMSDVQNRVHIGQSRAQSYVQFILYMYIFHITICLNFAHVHFWIDCFVHVQKSYVQKIVTNVQTLVQNLRSYVHFFMIYVQAE